MYYRYQIILVLFGVNFVVYERVVEWVFGGLRGGGRGLSHFTSLQPVDNIYISGWGRGGGGGAE